ncbi:proline--tRNA ligase [Synechococcus sp. HK01-R]|uniref:proline--tRNA ligase n=1 Tax=Synechococcus sp. HK01-R TaxID=2751171 RepID=UPI0016277ED7|nr:proline--tRNA ligase [Synechococcus sp. HK01-R]QNG26230.1 proline--tRNA ligase [Synechococcus sp. HK01-R]
MRVSCLMLVTLRDVPADAEIASHQLLLRGGYIRRVGSGIYAYMPLMWRVLRRISSIVREEMDATGALETLLPQLQPSELWERSGRWQGYTAGEGIMFNLEDRQGRRLGLGPTHEEVVTALAGDLLRSYRQLPVTLYQIQSKFRDEIRPRFGLMRGREFIMKDAYSFHADEADLRSCYEAMDGAYRRIFERCGLQAVAVDADSGAIGGAASQEFMVTAEAGEDLILMSESGDYAANLEKAVSIPPDAVALPAGERRVIDTPGQHTIEALCQNQALEPSQVVKVLALVARMESGAMRPLLVSLRGDQELNEVKLTNALAAHLGEGVLDLNPVSPEQIGSQGLQAWPFGALGPDLEDGILQGAKSWAHSFLRFADPTALELDRFVCGANEPDRHRWGWSWGDLGTAPIQVDLRNARAGDRCFSDPSQQLIERRGIEVGHIFQLGRKYSSAMEATFTNADGGQEPFWMGCYGIGVSRLAQAAVEQHHDEGGICWPLAIAPFQVIVVVASMQDDTQRQLGEQLYSQLLEAGIDALLDDRNERAGVKFKDADLIGIPWRLVVGRDAADGRIELVERQNRSTAVLPQGEALEKVISAIRSGLTVRGTTRTVA